MKICIGAALIWMATVVIQQIAPEFSPMWFRFFSIGMACICWFGVGFTSGAAEGEKDL